MMGSAAMTAVVSCLVVGVLSAAPAGTQPQGKDNLVDVRKIWDRAEHNAFTGLVRFRGRWLCVFREGTGHVSHDGALRVIASADGQAWSSLALLKAPSPDLPDLRDAKITTTPDGRLMLSGAGANRKTKPFHHQTYAWFSADGKTWTDPVAIGERDVWLWRSTWHGRKAYGVGYGPPNLGFTRLYVSDDGRTFRTIVKRLFEKGFPNEASLVFDPDGTCHCLLRRDGKPNTAQWGTAGPPYTKWTWKDSGVVIGGPCVIRLDDGRYVAAARRYDGGMRTSLMWVDARSGSLEEFLKLPSGGDTSYPGLVVHEGLLWVSYYSSHEGKTSIYLAKVKLPKRLPPDKKASQPTD